ncbi:MAG: T9SS type A sorting domain-containing protein [Bacteroidales bacterium]|nr:T9SS type A sorting domain-containing protein [Bacteroidales bacterium]MCF8343517.1 T9SS type A sorting domain-containing protein [Bacteroidales bacterium]MCF8377650.1 T9SS type A sorting domain-containing protein [Bacteroidales bacterium]
MKTKNLRIRKSIAQLALMLAAFLTMSAAIGQTYSYSDSWGKQGFSPEEQTRAGIDMTYSVTKFALEDIDIKGEAMKTVALPGHFLPNNEGAPNLPGSAENIAIPQGARAELRIVNMRTETIQNVEVAPAPRIPWDTDPVLEYEKDKKIYNRDAFYPAEPIQLSDVWKIRGVDVVTLGITPFQYNPVSKELKVIRDIEVEVVFEGGNGQFGEDRLRSKYWDPILSDALVNYKSLPSVDYDKEMMNNRDDEGCEYLIVTPNGEDFQDWADSIRWFRIQQGIITKVVTLDEIGGNNTNTLENYFNNAYNNWDIPPAAVLLLADYGSDPSNSITSPIWDNYCVSDNIYADVDNDDMPDMSFSRITARNASELEVMITKFLNHERTPPTNPDFYNEPITAMGWQTSRWFQICSETINGFFEFELGKEPVRENAIYQGSPGSTWSTAQNTSTVVDYFGPDGLGYIPATPAHLTDWGGNATRVNNDINSGAFIMQHRDHGSVTGWGEPDYDINDIDGCENEDLIFIMSINCLTGKYNASSECFTEKFHRYTHDGNNSGALGLLAASETSYSFVNDTYVWGVFDNMWPEFMPEEISNPEPRGLLPCFGNSAGKYFLRQSNWPYNTNNKEVTYHLFHHHGGSFSTLYSEVPQDLTVNHQDVIIAGVDYFTVTADVGASITFTVGDEIIGSGTGTGSPVDIPIVPQDPETVVKLVIFKTNYFRYDVNLDVIPADGPYCIYYGHEFNDDEGGNGNNAVDYGENIQLSLTLENLGSEDGVDLNTTINTYSSYVTLINSDTVFDLVPAGGTETVENGYSFKVADDAPDMTSVKIDVESTNGDEVWESTFSFNIFAPVLKVGQLSIDDSEYGNNNGLIDPGETFDVIISNSNTGHCAAYNTVGSLDVISPYILVENNEYELGNLPVLGGGNAVFTMTVDSAAPPGAVANFIYDVDAGNYNAHQQFDEEIGALVEDWESGDFDKFDWVLEGDKNWYVSSSSYQGDFSAVSGNIGNDQQTILKMTTTVSHYDSISFYIKASSEAGRDIVSFYINDNLKGEWSGMMEDFSYESYAVTGGNHTFKWVYAKDDLLSMGDDCAWLDYIVFPPMPVLSAFAGHDNYACYDGVFECKGVATNYSSVEWSTSGTGEFDNVNILDPIYTPSQEDYDNGTVNLSMMATDSEGDTDTDYMVLSFVDGPGIPLMPTGPDSVDVYTMPTTRYYTEKAEWAETYQWKIEPEDAGTTESVERKADITWNSDYTGMAYISVKALNECGDSEFSEAFEVIVDNSTVEIPKQEIEAISIYPNPSNGRFIVELPATKDEVVELAIFNATGTLIHSESIETGSNASQKEIDFSELPKGLYFVSLKGQETNHSSKLILN